MLSARDSWEIIYVHYVIPTIFWVCEGGRCWGVNLICAWVSFFFCFVFLLLFLCWWPWRSTVPPSVTLHQQLIGAPLGSTVSLDCTIESSPAALHFWSRSDGTDLHEAAKYLMQSSSSIGPVVTPAMAGASQPTWPSFRTQVKTKNY